jgi:hypothetical protein
MLSQHLLNFIKSKSSSQVKSPADMLKFGCLQYAINNEYFDDYSKFGWVRYISEEEKNNSLPNQEDFSYYINDIGFRGQYPSTDDKRLLAVFGCSIAFGQGVAEDKTYADVIAQHYSKKYLNLGIPGAGCHRTALTFSAATKIWDIETAVINLPPFTRFHYSDKTNHFQSILLSYEECQDELENIRKDVIQHFSDQFLLSQTIDAIQWIMDISKSKNINLVLASWDLDTIELVKTAFDSDILKFNVIDKARDGHPGVKSHKAFADDVIKILASGTYTC